MPLPEPIARKHLHTRAIDYRGYEREDGLWDIEAHMTDKKTYQFSNNWRGDVPIGEPLHEMLLRVTIDDNFVIQDVVAVTEHSPFEMCPSITSAYKAVIGIQMGAGWRKAIRMKVGGVKWLHASDRTTVSNGNSCNANNLATTQAQEKQGRFRCRY